MRSPAGLEMLQICTTITSVTNGAVRTCLAPLYHMCIQEHGDVMVSMFGGVMQMAKRIHIVHLPLRRLTYVTRITGGFLGQVACIASVLLVTMPLLSRVD